MKPRTKGKGIIIHSALAYRSIPLQSAYCAAKAANRGFIDSLRCELIEVGRRIFVSGQPFREFFSAHFADIHLQRRLAEICQSAAD